MWWTSGCGRIELQIPKSLVSVGYHQGDCEAGVKELMAKPAIAKQLEKIHPDSLVLVLQEYGAWDKNELKDHQSNLQRLVWIACGDLQEEINSKS